MGGGWLITGLVLAVLWKHTTSEERWSRLATPERRQHSDWVPLTCANCRPVANEQGLQGQASDSLPSVLTPPPREEGARLLPPPPPDGLLQQAATGFLQAYTQQQPPHRKPHQFLQETSQSINRPQAQFLTASKQSPQQYFQEPSQEFQPPQPQFSSQPTRQVLPFSQQGIPESSPYLNQPLLIGPQFLASPFFPQTSIPQVQPLNLQPVSPLTPNAASVTRDNFQFVDRPLFLQQITPNQQAPPAPQHTIAQAPSPQLQYTVNQTENYKGEENEEVQLLYVPVETLNQRAKNLGRPKSLPSNEQVNTQLLGTNHNRFENPGKSYESSTNKPQQLDQNSFNNEKSKQQFSTESLQFQQQQPPEDQEQLLTQTHSVRQQYIKQPQQQFQQPKYENVQNFKAEPQVTKNQYNFKQADQFQKQTYQNEGNFNLQLQNQQHDQFQQQSPIESVDKFQFQSQSVNHQPYTQQPLQHDVQNVNTQTFNANQQFTTQQNIKGFQQQLPPTGQSSFDSPSQLNKQEIRSQLNAQIQPLQVNQPGFGTLREQPYINQPINIDQQLNRDQVQVQQLSTEPNLAQQQDEIQQQTISPVSHTRAPEIYTTQQAKKQRFRTQPQVTTRNTPQTQTVQPLQHFSQDYQQSEFVSSSPSVGQQQDVTTQGHSVSQHHTFLNHQNVNTQQYQQDNSKYQQQQNGYLQSNYNDVSSVAPPASSTPLLQKTTPAPNQPPLSVYMETTEDTKVNDVLRLLKNAKTIQVLDTVGPESPQVFVGPSNLKAPTGYIKFELPYLNSLENNRVERKVDKLPFFVAPLNFNPPPGYSKIPFPAPHIGSVVVSNVTVLKNAFHEKGFESQTASSSEKYLDQYTLPAQISPISPQLPSLINSLQDEIYSSPSTTALPSTTSEQTTLYTTSYRGRGSNRGTQRGSSSYATSPSPTRRPHSRTRRPYDGKPYSRRQSTTSPAPLIESSTEDSVPQFTPQPEQPSPNTEFYNVQNTASSTQTNTENNQQHFTSSNTGTFHDNSFANNQYNQERFAQNQQQVLNQPFEQNLNVQQTDSFSNTQPAQQYFENTQPAQQYFETPQLDQNSNVPVQEIAQTTASPTIQTPVQQEQTFKSQRTSGSRRDPNRHHQRFRGRQRLTTTTTTENYDEPSLPIQQQFNQNVDYQNNLNINHPRFQNQQRLVENTHFTASTPTNKFNIQTERADIGVQTTERVFNAKHENRFNQQDFNTDQFTSHPNVHHQTNEQTHQHTLPSTGQQTELPLQQPRLSHPQQTFQLSDYNSTNSGNNEFDYSQVPQQNNQVQYTSNQFNLGSQEQVNPREHQEDYQQVKFAHQGNFGLANQQIDKQLAVQEQNLANHNQEAQNYFHNTNLSQTKPIGQTYSQTEQHTLHQLIQQNPQERQPVFQEQSQVPNLEQYTNNQPSFSSDQRNLEISSNNNQGVQSQHISTAGQFQQFAAVIPPNVGSKANHQEQEVLAQTPETQTAYPQASGDSHVQHNQDRLVKYSRTHSKLPVIPVEQTQFQTNIDNADVSTTEEATTRASLVRIRGRVRSRQRGSTRNYQSTTTEAPNYPNSYLSRRRNNQEKSDESQEYAPRKRPNYGGRQTSTPNHYNREVIAEQSTEQETQERLSSSERYQDYSSASTTSTEEPTTKPMKRYQHILNRNKVRRVRPTNSPSTSGSSGATKFLLPTTPPPVTRLPGSRGRIRKPVNNKIATTTEYPQVKPSWNEGNNFAPSAGSNEILEPLYQTKDKAQPSFGFQHSALAAVSPHKSTPKPVVGPSENDFWNQAVTIQQSTSFDFKPDGSSVTPPSFQSEDSKAQPIWNGQIELQDGKYYDVFNQQHVLKTASDQTPFSSDQQKIVYKDVKSRLSEGKEDQYPEKTVDNEEEDTPSSQRVYPVYRDIVKPAESEETSQVFDNSYIAEEKKHQEKDAIEHSDKGYQNGEELDTEENNGKKEGPLKRKIHATNPGKKGNRRRGSWVRVRVRKTGQGQDMFETAESQNLASVSENSIQTVTKTSEGKVSPPSDTWSTQETKTELPQTNTEAVSEPAETINFEDALKDMLKEFITNSEEGKGIGATEGNTETPAVNEAYNKTEDSQTIVPDEHVSTGNIEKNTDEDEISSTEKPLESISDSEQEIVNRDETKTILPETVSENHDSTTLFHTEDNSETTIEPAVTTHPQDKDSDDLHQPDRVYKIQPPRVLGTSTTTEISLETEICYRGRCVKTKKEETKGGYKKESVSDLLSME